MFRAKVKVEMNKCGRCGHVWPPRTKPLGQAAVCPKCKTRYWNRPRKLKAAKKG